MILFKHYPANSNLGVKIQTVTDATFTSGLTEGYTNDYLKISNLKPNKTYFLHHRVASFGGIDRVISGGKIISTKIYDNNNGSNFTSLVFFKTETTEISLHCYFIQGVGTVDLYQLD